MNSVKRTYLPGEEWLYYKIYCGVHTADAILVNKICALTEQLLADKLIVKWFFIRYHDPDSHIRLRLQLVNAAKLAEIVNLVNTYFAPLIEQKTVWSLQIDTYSRELERYGEATMAISETIFFHDSQLIVQLLNARLDEETYFLMILAMVNQFIALFDMPMENKLAFLKMNSDAYKAEFEIERVTKTAIDKKYRKLSPRIVTVLANEKLIGTDTIFCTLGKPFVTKLKKCVDTMYEVENHNNLELSKQSVIASHVHMLVNRAFRNRQRFFELIIYDFLLRNLKSTSLVIKMK